MNDQLNEFIRTGSSEAFRRVMEEHVDAVYSQCLRQLHDRALADDVTQTIFILLAQKAAKLPLNTVLEGWLFNTTRYCCGNALRTAARRRCNEQKAARMRTEAILSSKSDGTLHAEADEMLDEAIAYLGETDRNAVLLRFFKQRSLREVGEALGISENTARQRVFRAVEKLRSYFGKRGVTVPSATIVAWLEIAVKPAGQHIVHAAVESVAAKCAASAAARSAGNIWRMKWMAPKVAAVLAIAGAVTTGVVINQQSAPAQSSPQIQSPTMLAQAPLAQPTANLDSAPPATQPFDQNSPANTLAKLCATIRANDRVAIDECLCDDGADPAAAALARTFFQEEATIYRLEQVWQARLGNRMDPPDMGFDLFPGHGGFDVLLQKLGEIPGGPEVQIDGDTARVRVAVPAEIFAGTGIHRIAAMGRWSGAILVMKKLEGHWKLDTDRTLNLVVVLNRQAGNADDAIELENKVAEGLIAQLAETTKRIDSGSIKSRAAALSALRSDCEKVLLRVRVSGNNLFLVLPVIGGEK